MTAIARTAPIAGLQPGTTYHFRMVASDASGTTYGPDMTFTTPPMAPTVNTNAATLVGSNGATLNGTVDPNGGALSDAHFEYGTTPAYGSSAPLPAPLPGGNTAAAASLAISGLTPNTQYHFRLVCTNAGGTTAGQDQTFTTLALAPLVNTAAATGISQSTATLNGTVDGQGGNITDCHFEYGTTTSYGSTAPCS